MAALAGTGAALSATLLIAPPAAEAKVPVWPAGVKTALPANLQSPAKVSTERYLAKMRKRMKKRSRKRDLGRDVSVFVADLQTGKRVFSRRARNAQTPASVMKSATALAVLSARGAYHQFATKVIRSGNTLTLVGSGDPLLESADLTELASRTALAVREYGEPTGKLRIQFDDSLFEWPTSPAGWLSNYYPSYAKRPFGLTRRWVSTNDGAKDAAKYFRKALREDENLAVRRGATRVGAGEYEAAPGTVPDSGATPTSTPPTAEPVNPDPAATPTVDPTTVPSPVAPSAPIAPTLIAQFDDHTVADAVNAMMPSSDNSIAENLIRHVASARGASTSAEGAAAAVTAELKSLRVPLRNTRIVDGSGLSRQNTMSAKTSAAINRAMMDPSRPDLSTAIYAMPRAGVSGTLNSRFGSKKTKCARDRVSAKTGTLRSVVTLSGIAAGKDGRPRVFSILINDYRSYTSTARYWIDAMGAAITGCR